MTATPAPHRKRTYPNRRTAIRAALRSSRRSGVALRIYPCRTCRGFHLTKQPKNGV